MSLIQSDIANARHTVVNYISTASNGNSITKAFDGQRLVTACYRTDSKTGVSRTNRACSIPKIAVTDIESRITVLMPVLVEHLESVQDKIFKGLLDANGVNGTVVDIADNDINLDAVIAYLADSNAGERLTKESIGVWFTENVEEKLMVTLATKLGVSDSPTDQESKQIELITNEYKAKLAMLAGGKTSYNEKLAVSLKKCLELVPDDKLAIKFNARLDKMIADSRVKVDLFDLL